MGKKAILFVFLIILFVGLQFVTSADSDKVTKGYQCLQSQVGTCAGLSPEQQAFTLLALRDLGTCKAQLKINPGTSVKQKALSLIALKTVGEDTTALENGLLSQKIIPPGINWYLQVETKGESTCRVAYGGQIYNFNIAANKKLSGSGGSCLIIDTDKKNYWFRISQNSGCQEKTYEISCDSDQGFLTNLLYQDPTSSTIFVSDKTHTSPGTSDLGSKVRTSEKINSYCIGNGNSCDYEGTLWAAIALDSQEHYPDVNAMIPYLMAKAPSNEKYFPSAFLYFLTELPDYRSQMLDKQKPFSGLEYFSAIPESNKVYDTALALFSLSQDSATITHKENARKWLLDNQASNGCWSSSSTTIRDTAFALLSAWPDQTPQPGQTGCTNNAACVADNGEGWACNLTTNTCYQIQTSQTGCTNNAACVADHEAGWFCDLPTGQCRDGTTTDTCSLDNKCTNSSIPRCYEGICRECRADTQNVDCGSAEHCNNGACVPNPQTLYCGDGIITPINSNGVEEECDGTTRGSITDCVSLDRGYTNGSLSCYAPGTADQCTFNVTGCYNQTTNACTSNANCTAPNSTCNITTGICEPPNSQAVCDNGILEEGEDCDGTIFRNNLTLCTDFDKDYGNVTCNPKGSSRECLFNLSQCHFNDFCITNSDCASVGTRYECDDSGQCVPPLEIECTWNSECINFGDGYICDPDTAKCVPDTSSDTTLCEEDMGYYCRSANVCLNDGGEILSDFECSSGITSKCCSKESSTQTCTASSGDICNSNQDCSGGQELTTSDLSYGQICCIGTCVNKSSSSQSSSSQSKCEYFNGQCKSSCGDGEVSNTNECNEPGYVCCESGDGGNDGSGGSLLWLWILLILIVLVVVGIIFREKLRVLLMRVKSKFGKGGQPPRRPGFPPPSGGPQRRPILRRILPPNRGPPQGLPPRPAPSRPTQASPKKEEKPKSDLDDVLKKLKDMGN